VICGVWRVTVLVIALVLICQPAAAQSSEISGVLGFTSSVELARQAPELSDLRIPGGFTFSIGGTRFLTPHWGAEVSWTQQASSLEVGTQAGSAELYKMTLAQIQANVVYQFGEAEARLRPFAFGGAGATLFSAHDLESDTKAAFGFGAGVKYFRWRTVGVRGQFRYKPTWLNDDSEGSFCAPFGFCQSWLQQVDIGIGAIVRF
jgi:Outer membrane protein beta-barrel domain